MESNHSWKNDSNRVQQLENDLNFFRTLWEKREGPPLTIKEKTYLQDLSTSILTLDRHAEELTSDRLLGESASLIHYLLQTPWGAPFVGESTLLEAAKIFPDEKFDESTLSHVLTQFEEYKERVQMPLMQSLHQIQQEIHKARQKAA